MVYSEQEQVLFCAPAAEHRPRFTVFFSTSRDHFPLNSCHPKKSLQIFSTLQIGLTQSWRPMRLPNEAELERTLGELVQRGLGSGILGGDASQVA